jgi:hypothetical protein
VTDFGPLKPPGRRRVTVTVQPEAAVTDSDSEQSSLVMLHIFGILVLGYDAAAFKFKFKLLSKPEARAAQP